MAILKEQTKLIDELADEIADMIIQAKKSATPKAEVKPDAVKTRSESGLENRLAVIEERLNKLVNSFRIVAIEAERELNEKIEGVNKENEERIVRLQGQIETLRSAMIRLGNAIRELEESSKKRF